MSHFVHAFSVMVVLLMPMLAKSNLLTEHPASITELTFESSGSRMSGLAYLAAGAGVHPTMLLLHGYPGNEKNLDVAQAMRSKGWNVVFFHYRGSWGSEGEFSFRAAEQDVQVVLRYIREQHNAAKLHIDRNKISVVGHSMGGHMAIAGILDNPAVRCAISYDGANLGANDVGFINDPKTKIDWRGYSDTLFMLNGWSGAKASAETQQYGKALNLLNRASNINGRPVMLIAANTEVIPIDLHIKPLLVALQATENSQVLFKLIDDDHSFSSSREELIATTAEFLNAQCTD
jgi:uncharacterized protein